MSDQCSSVFLPVPTIPLLSNSSPTALDLLLTKISNWEVFANHLPGVTQSLIESIKREVPPLQQLEKLLDSWLHICPHASWLHVFIVLLEIKEDELYLAILEDLSSKRPAPLSTTRYVVGASKDVVVHNIKDLSQWFTTLLQEVKSTLSDKPLQELVNKTKRFLGLEGGLGPGITNIDQLFNEVQPYCNYLNIELIQYLTRTTTPALASSVTKYAKNLLSFLQSAQLEFVTSAMTKPTSSKTKTTSAVTLKLSYHWNKYSLYTLLRAMECCLKVKAIYTRHIIRDKSDPKLLLFKFFLPLPCEQHIRTLLASNQKKMSQFGIIKVHISGRPVFTSDIEFASFESSCFRAVTDGNAILLVTILLLQLVSADCINKARETPLIIAAGEGKLQILCTLLSSGASINAFDTRGYNALTIAIQNNHLAVAQLLSEAQRKVNLEQQLKGTIRSTSILVEEFQKEDQANKKDETASQTMVMENEKIADKGVERDETSVALTVRKNQESTKIEQSASDKGENDTLVGTASVHMKDEEPVTVNKEKIIVKHEEEEECRMGSTRTQYVKIQEKLPELTELLVGNPQQILQMTNQLIKAKVIPNSIRDDIALVQGVAPTEKATRLLSSVLATLKTTQDPEKVFDNIASSFQKVDRKFMEILHGPGSGSSSLKLTEKEEAELKSTIERLNNEFANLAAEVRSCFEKSIQSGKLELTKVVRVIGELMKKPVAELKKAHSIDDLFDSIRENYNMFDYEFIEYFITTFLLNETELQTLLENYKRSMENFEELTSLKEIEGKLKGKLHLNSHEATIKLNKKWGKITLKCLRIFLEHYFEKSIGCIGVSKGCICISFPIPINKSEEFVNSVSSYTDHMYRLGVFKIVIGERIILDEPDSIDLEKSLQQFSRDGDWFEVSMLIQLGANINWQNTIEKTALMLAAEKGHTRVVKELLIAGADDSLCDNEGHTALAIATMKDDLELISILKWHKYGIGLEEGKESITKDINITKIKEKKEESVKQKQEEAPVEVVTQMKEESTQEDTKQEHRKDEPTHTEKEKDHKKEEVMGYIELIQPSEKDCRQKLSQTKNHKDIMFASPSPDIAYLFISLLEELTLQHLVIQDTNLTPACIKSLSHLIAKNDTLEELELRNCVEKNYDSYIFDEGLADDLCLGLRHNTTLKKLSLRSVRLSEDALYVFLDVLYDHQMNLTLEIDANHEKICSHHSYYKDIGERLKFK